MRDRLTDWERFVAELASASGYPAGLCLDDYYQDLANRDSLERDGVDALLQPRLLAADETLRANTIPSCQTRLSESHWWHWRLPLRAGEDLKDEAKRLGFTAEDVTVDW